MTKWRSFEEARKFAHSLKLKNMRAWIKYSQSGKIPETIPKNPRGVYKNSGWKGYGDWLGNNTIPNQQKKFQSFSDARKFAKSLNFKSTRDWHKYCQSGERPTDIPANPEQQYKNKGWKGYGDFLGYGYLEFDDARTVVRKLAKKNNINSLSQWKKFIESGKKPNNIPTTPELVYRGKGWNGVGDWLGTGELAPKDRQYWSFDDSRKFAHSKKCKKRSDWSTITKSNNFPKKCPKSPDNYYRKKGWISWGDFLGTGFVAHQTLSKTWLPWKDAKPIYRKLAIEYGLKNGTDWIRFSKKEISLLRKLKIPQDPWRVYSKERILRSMKDD
tara:strand:+ start:180 stop:1163 length:984 start_codon:yes stop_codon:yes gene_type:complete